MNTILKHSIIFLSSVALAFSLLFLPAGPIGDKKGVSDVSFGYPFPFITQDFTAYDNALSFFPRYFNFSFDESIEIVRFSFWNAFLSFLSVFIAMELLIASLEFLKGILWIKKDEL